MAWPAWKEVIYEGYRAIRPSYDSVTGRASGVSHVLSKSGALTELEQWERAEAKEMAPPKNGTQTKFSSSCSMFNVLLFLAYAKGVI